MTKPTLTRAIIFLVYMIVAVGPLRARPALRAVEPRLSVDQAWLPCSPKKVDAQPVIEEPECGTSNFSRRVVSNAARECESVNTQIDAIKVLPQPHQCIEAAVATLKKLTDGRQATASAMSDLAAAYIVRAQRKHRPSDFVRALDAADRAVKLAPRDSASRFNQALALEALGFDEEAISSWDYLRQVDAPGWVTEEAAHSARLTKRGLQQFATRWDDNLKRLSGVAEANDRKAVAQLVAPYPSAALHYLEAEVLPAWATAHSTGDKRKAERQLHLAAMMAAALADLTGDDHALEGVTQIQSLKTSKLRLSAIQKGILLLAGGKYADAEAVLTRAGSPFHVVATIARASAMFSEPAAAITLLATVEKEVRRKGYVYLLAIVHIRRAYFLFIQSRYFDSLSEYDAAEAICRRIRDEQNLGIIYTRKIGILRVLGHKDLTWREVIRARQYESRIVELAQKHLLLGEITLSAVALGYPEVALRYQNAAMKILQDQLASPNGVDDSEVSQWRGLLGVAFGQRAAIRGRLGDPHAIDDLRQAERLVSEGTFSARRIRMAPIREVEGQLLLHSDPARAVEAFKEAYELAWPVYYRTYSASLLVERAEAHLVSRERAAAEADLQNAVAVLRSEDRIVLQDRQKGQAEPLWSPYFSRSRDAYALLIQQLMGEQKWEAAFGYSEQFRAYELLNLVRTWTHNSEPLDLPHIRAALPPATFIVEYFVLGDRTYAWLIGPNEKDFAPFTFKVGNEQIAEWTADLARNAIRRNDEAFLVTLRQVSASLIREPLARIARISAERKLRPRVIFVPDAATHGIPFAALLVDPARPDDYLIQHCPVAVAPSATLYAFSLARDAAIPPAKRPSVLLIGNPKFDSRLNVAARLNELQLADAEVEEIGRTYQPVARVIPLLHENATVASFFGLEPQCAIVHFAGHAIANPDAPSESLLLFAPSPPTGQSTGHSGVLTAAELLTKLRSDQDQMRLFVMSACSTAGGVPIGAEGLAPLVRPILAAGVPAAVGSLWDIPEYNAKTLLALFHQHYREGHDADVALQLAQRDLLHHKKKLLKSPAVWGSFQMIGFASSPFGAQKERK
jgi:CHAT domain-containing protein